MSSTTKEDILHAASRMLLSKGLNGFSLQELAETLDLKKASLFHHYPSKTALAVELYRFYQASFVLWTEKFSHLASEKQILSYVDELTNWICLKKRVCPVGALSLEWGLVDPLIQVEIMKLHRLQKEWLTTLFKDLQKTSGLRIPVPSAVMQTMGLIQGSIQLARITQDPGLVRKNLKTHLKLLKETP